MKKGASLAREYVRKLKPIEAERYYIQITKDARNMFPSRGGKIRVYHKGREFELKIDHHYRIWIGKLRQISDFLLEEGDTIVISREKPPRMYSISKR